MVASSRARRVVLVDQLRVSHLAVDTPRRRAVLERARDEAR